MSATFALGGPLAAALVAWLDVDRRDAVADLGWSRICPSCRGYATDPDDEDDDRRELAAAVDVAVASMAAQHRAAILAMARAMRSGATTWTHPALPDDEARRDAITAEALAALVAALKVVLQ